MRNWSWSATAGWRWTAWRAIRQLQLIVDYFTAESGTYLIDDLFDTGSAAVEAAVLADVTLGGQCRDLHLNSVDYVIEPDEERRWGTARHTFNCIYLTTD